MCSKSGCCCVKPSKITSIVGFILSLIELILAAVYNFHAFGFSLAIIGLVSSVVFFFITRKDAKRTNDKRDSMRDEDARGSNQSTFKPVPSVEELAK